MIKGRELLICLAIKYDGDWEKMYEAIKNKERLDEDEVSKSLEKVNSDVVTILDDNYPKAFKALYKPPFTIFYHGDLELIENNNLLTLGMIGSRQYSEYGKNMVYSLIKDLKKDYIIISGLARGIDGFSHQASIDNNLKTVAVLGSGINYIYPSENKRVYEDILSNNGLVISEYPNKVQPKKDNFVFRNRLIAGLSKAIVVIEAGFKSGSLTTVRAALQLGKDILCVPALANTGSSCNHLIKEGAYLIETSEDIMEIVK